MAEITGKHVLLKDKDGNYLLPETIKTNIIAENNLNVPTSDAVSRALYNLIASISATEGSNDNGSWRRYSDGFTIQQGVYSNPALKGGEANAQPVYFPRVFKDTPTVLLQPNYGVGQANDFVVLETYADYFKIRNTNQTQNSNNMMCHWVAIGHTDIQ